MSNMDEQLVIIEQLKKTLQLLTVEQEENKIKASTINAPTIESNDEVSAKFLYEDCADLFIDFTYKNPTTYHVVKFAANMLEKSGFKYLCEKGNWDKCIGKEGGKFYTIRNGTNLVAFIVGKNWTIERGAGVIGSHIDSLAVKLKPSSVKPHVEGFDVLGVAPYGGALGAPWFDRDLGIGGRVLYHDENSDVIKEKLIDSTPYPIAKIPSLAPHFGKPAEGPFDKEDQAVPIVGYPTATPVPPSEKEKTSPLYGKHCINLLRYIAKLAGLKVCQLTQMDLDLFDVQKGTIGGVNQDFIFAPRLDDRLCSFAALWGMDMYSQTVDVSKFDGLSVLALYDNEEVGSMSSQGAKGGLLESIIERVAQAHANATCAEIRTLYANSIILSADVNHMYNPNFKEVYLPNHSPKPNVGVTLSLDPNGHMATDNVGVAFVEQLARKNDDKLQYFQIKNNSRSGGTIGPTLSLTGARVIDLGIAQLSMHSIRAATGSQDVGLGIKFFNGFYQNWRSVYDNFGDL